MSTTEMQMIPIKFLQWPGAPLYVRGKVNKDIVAQWTQDVKDAGGRYFFNKPIEVWVPTPPAPPLEKGKRYLIVDGYKRALACNDAGVKSIPGILKTFKDDQEAFAYQFQASLGEGEFLSKQARAHYVKTCREVFKLKLSDIAKITKLSEAQVSRIARNVKPSKAGGGTRKAKAKRFSVKSFLEEVRFLGIQYQNYKDSVDKFIADKASELTTLFKAIEKALPLLAQEEAGEA